MDDNWVRSELGNRKSTARKVLIKEKKKRVGKKYKLIPAGKGTWKEVEDLD